MRWSYQDSLQLLFVAGLIFLIGGCCQRKKEKEISHQNPPSPVKSLERKERREELKEPATPGLPATSSAIQAPLEAIQRKIPISEIHLLKKKVMNIFSSGVFRQDIERDLKRLWNLSTLEQKDELLGFLSVNSKLSRASQGLKSWRIRSFLLKIQTTEEEDLLLLKYLKNSTGMIQPDFRFYLSSKYQKNLGGNTILWRELIEKGSEP